MMIMKKIFYLTALIAMAFAAVSCQEEAVAEQEHVMDVYLADQPEADLSKLQADLKGCTYNFCIKADFEYEVALSGVFAQQWVSLGDRTYDAEKACDVLPVVIAAADNAYEGRTATIYISAKDNVQSQCVTICQGYDLFSQDIALKFKDGRSRYFIAGDCLELVADNPNATDFIKESGLALEYSVMVPEDTENVVADYNDNHYADCELLPADMYSLSLAPSADGRKITLRIDVDQTKVRAQDREKPFVLPLQIVAQDGLYESEMYYVTVPTYTTDVSAFANYDLKPQMLVNLNGYTVNKDGMIGRNQLLIYNVNPGNDKAVLYCPGGAYGETSGDESKIEHLLGTNTTIATLLYRLPCRQWQGCHEYPVEDARQALEVLDENAGIWGQYRKIGVSGRSAGGHLAGVTAAYNKDLVDFQILLYPVITMEPGKTHTNSMKRFLGENPSQELVDMWSVHKLVDADTPRAFVAYSTNDDVVMSQYNGAVMKSALEAQDNAAQHKVMVYANGKHSSGSWTGFPECLHEWMNNF